MNLKKTNFDMALMASHGSDRPIGTRTFGLFTAKGVLDADERFAFEAGRYAYVGAPLSLRLWVLEGAGLDCGWSPYVDLTKNSRPHGCSPTECVVKTFGENAHLRGTLLALGFFVDTGRRMTSGLDQLEIWTLTSQFEDAFDTTHPESAFV